MSLFENMMNSLNGSVGQNLDNNPLDIFKVEKALMRTGNFNGDHSNGFITAELDKGIRKFQKDNNLKTDGAMYPNGETEQALLKQNTPIQSSNIPKPIRKPEIISPTERGNKLLDLIGQVESDNNYNVIVGGEVAPLTKMTVKDVQKLQQDLKNKSQNTAVGRYQIKNSTFKETINDLGIDENEIFDEKLQDKMARRLLTIRDFEKYKAGKISTEQMILNLSQEWAAIPKDGSNESYHKGVGNNKSRINYEDIKNLLELQ